MSFPTCFTVVSHYSCPYSGWESHTTWTFSISHWRLLKTRTLGCRQMIQGTPLLRKNKILSKLLQDLFIFLLKKKSWSRGRDLRRPSITRLLTNNCQTIFVAYCQTCWVREQSKNMCSTNSIFTRPQCGRLSRPLLRSPPLLYAWLTNGKQALLSMMFVPNHIPLRHYSRWDKLFNLGTMGLVNSCRLVIQSLPLRKNMFLHWSPSQETNL